MWQRLLITQGTRISSLQLYPLRRSCGALSSEHCRCHLLLVILRQSLSARRVWRDCRCDITYQSGALPWPTRPIRADPAPTGYQVSVRCQSVSICLCQDIPQSGRVSGDWSWILDSSWRSWSRSATESALPVRESILSESESSESVISSQWCHVPADR